jgi:hypothetical protein
MQIVILVRHLRSSNHNNSLRVRSSIPVVGGVCTALGTAHHFGFGHFFIVWFRRGLAAAWSRLPAIRLLLVPIGVGVGIGIGIDSACVLGLVLTHGVASLPEFRQPATRRVQKSHLLSFDSDTDTDPDPDPDYNPGWHRHGCRWP